MGNIPQLLISHDSPTPTPSTLFSSHSRPPVCFLPSRPPRLSGPSCLAFFALVLAIPRKVSPYISLRSAPGFTRREQCTNGYSAAFSTPFQLLWYRVTIVYKNPLPGSRERVSPLASAASREVGQEVLSGGLVLNAVDPPRGDGRRCTRVEK